jgi:hypothetical protein
VIEPHASASLNHFCGGIFENAYDNLEYFYHLNFISPLAEHEYWSLLQLCLAKWFHIYIVLFKEWSGGCIKHIWCWYMDGLIVFLQDEICNNSNACKMWTLFKGASDQDFDRIFHIHVNAYCVIFWIWPSFNLIATLAKTYDECAG